jgi:hypothetical protein
MKFAQRQDRAMALAAVLFLSVVLFGLGLIFLTSLQRDSAFQLETDRKMKTRMMARSGIDYYYLQESAGAVGLPLGVTVTYNVDPYCGFNITRLPDAAHPVAGCMSVGFIRNENGQILKTTSTLVMQEWGLERYHNVYEPD